MAQSFATTGADQVYATGPETIADRSSTILVGPVSAYSRRIVSTTQPPGSDAVPLKWIVSGRVDKPTILKGSMPGPVTFSKPEQSLILPNDQNQEEWELDYGDLEEGDEVVLFLSGEPADPVIRAIPSGLGGRNLAALVRDIVAIQSRPENESQAAWLSYAEQTSIEEGRKAALRSLLQMQVDWTHLLPVLERLVQNPNLSDEMRAFSFGIVVFGLTQGRWGPDQVEAVDFLCRQFESEGQPQLMLRYILSLKLALRYTMEEGVRAAREPMRRRIVDCLKGRESTASMVPQLAEQYRQLRAAYPRLF